MSTASKPDTCFWPWIDKWNPKQAEAGRADDADDDEELIPLQE